MLQRIFNRVRIKYRSMVAGMLEAERRQAPQGYRLCCGCGYPTRAHLGPCDYCGTVADDLIRCRRSQKLTE